MSLTMADQLKLLYDLLEEQMIDHTGSISEYQQIKRIVQTITAKNTLTNSQLINLLPEIYKYGLQGETAQSLPEHIVSNKDNIEIWTNAIAQTTMYHSE